VNPKRRSYRELEKKLIIGGVLLLKCERCGYEGESSSFKLREIHSINRNYYVCRKCGAANRPSVRELNPKSRWEKKALATAKEIRSKMLRSSAAIKFTILVWGPGQSGVNDTVYKKRQQVRDALRAKNIDAYFSEELSLTDDLGNPIAHDTSEVFQSDYCDLVINIADSTSSLMEAEAFTEGLDDRCLLWLRKDIRGFPEGLIESLTSTGRAPLYFDDEDIKSCVIAKGSEDWVYAMRTRELKVETLLQRLTLLSIKQRRKLQ
jgi:hypothetical protein